jgi:hypothetical protein
VISVKSAKTFGEFTCPSKYKFGFIGGEIDDRTSFSCQYVNSNSEKSSTIFYDLAELCLFVDGEKVLCQNFPDYILSLNINSFIVDATSLGIPELALIVDAAFKHRIQILFLYVEPKEYPSNREVDSLDEDFELSDQIIGFESAGIPEISKPVDRDVDRRFVFFLGFEESRLTNALEVYDVSEKEAKVVFGVPAFQPGWEARSIKRNMQALKDFQLERKHIEFCGANSVESTLSILRDFAGRNKGKLINLVPIGTKPHALGALIFLAETENSNLLYDQPEKKRGRSEGVGEKHFYSLEYSK